MRSRSAMVGITRRNEALRRRCVPKSAQGTALSSRRRAALYLPVFAGFLMTVTLALPALAQPHFILKGHTRKAMASVGLDNVVPIWDIATRKEIAELTGHRRRIHFVTFSHGGRQLATAGMDWTVKLWDTPTQASPTLQGAGGGGGGVRAACRGESEKLCGRRARRTVLARADGSALGRVHGRARFRAE